MTYSRETLRGLLRCCAAALVCILAFTSCQTTQTLADSNRSVSLEVDKAWHRLGDQETDGTVFRARHERHALELELQALSSPVRLSAAPVWTRAWLSSRYGSVQIEDTSEIRVSGYPAARFAIRVPTRSLAFEYVAVNAGGTTYLLTIWGEPEAFSAWESTTNTLADGLTLPRSGNSDSLACRDETRQLELDGLVLSLAREPTDGPHICDVWDTQGTEDQIEWSLDSRLLTGMIRTEELPYEIPAGQYRDVFLERTDPEGERTEYLGEIEVGVIVRLERATNPVDMTDTYVFITHRERGWLVQLSTPTALMDDNQAVIDDIIESLRLNSAE
ncbi:MAG: hypothetical protein ACQEVA_20865 [Myxococcota bacterium]